MRPAANAEAVVELADQCVMCGLCLPHCPTYALAQDETESPRGRIALAKAVATGAIPVSESVLKHLDQCLACRACETACPSNVQYENLLVQTRALIEPARQQRTLMHRLAAYPVALARLARVANFIAAARWLPVLACVLPQSSSLRRLLTSMPPAPRALRETRHSAQTSIRATGENAQTIALFEGCVASAFDRDTLAATRLLLEAFGHRVLTSAETLCCGALPRHAGHADATGKVVARTRDALTALTALSAAEVVVSASGCYSALTVALQKNPLSFPRRREPIGLLDVTEEQMGSRLRGNGERRGCGNDEGRASANDEGLRVVDAAQRIANDPALASLRFRPLNQRAALHLPCSQVNGAHSVDATRALLARIPGLTVVDLPTQPRCCGAAGSYYIEHPDIADQLRDERLDQLDGQSPDLLLTSNIGCRIHLGNGLRQRDREVHVLHPLTLLAQQLEMP
ncbi:MAG: (Fe-S)-binding protein [Dokdonella sp.]